MKQQTMKKLQKLDKEIEGLELKCNQARVLYNNTLDSKYLRKDYDCKVKIRQLREEFDSIIKKLHHKEAVNVGAKLGYLDLDDLKVIKELQK